MKCGYYIDEQCTFPGNICRFRETDAEISRLTRELEETKDVIVDLKEVSLKNLSHVAQLEAELATLKEELANGLKEEKSSVQFSLKESLELTIGQLKVAQEEIKRIKAEKEADWKANDIYGRKQQKKQQVL